MKPARYALHLVELDSDGCAKTGSTATMLDIELEKLTNKEIVERYLIPASYACLNHLRDQK